MIYLANLFLDHNGKWRYYYDTNITYRLNDLYKNKYNDNFNYHLNTDESEKLLNHFKYLVFDEYMYSDLINMHVYKTYSSYRRAIKNLTIRAILSIIMLDEKTNSKPYAIEYFINLYTGRHIRYMHNQNPLIDPSECERVEIYNKPIKCKFGDKITFKYPIDGYTEGYYILAFDNGEFNVLVKTNSKKTPYKILTSDENYLPHLSEIKSIEDNYANMVRKEIMPFKYIWCDNYKKELGLID